MSNNRESQWRNEPKASKRFKKFQKIRKTRKKARDKPEDKAITIDEIADAVQYDTPPELDMSKGGKIITASVDIDKDGIVTTGYTKKIESISSFRPALDSEQGEQVFTVRIAQENWYTYEYKGLTVDIIQWDKTDGFEIHAHKGTAKDLNDTTEYIHKEEYGDKDTKIEQAVRHSLKIFKEITNV